MRYLFVIVWSFLGTYSVSQAQMMVTKTIRSFGAKGDGKTNDSEAFQKAAAYFNARGGKGKLIISKGTYLVGRQAYTGGKPNAYAFTGASILYFKNCSNLTVQGATGALIKYCDSLRFGSFDPVSKKVFNNNNPSRPDNQYAATLGYCIALENCTRCSIANLQLNGNNKSVVYGGGFGDQGIQLTHYGVFIYNSQHIKINQVNASYFALDGICVNNRPSDTPDDIQLISCQFEFNNRQGLSWVSGNHLLAKNCSFSHTGRAGGFSAPGAGVDIEAEDHPVSGGLFDHCSFINNKGCGLLVSTGLVSSCRFNGCTFWGVTNYAVWVTKPGFSFNSCNMYGTTVHCYNSPNDKDATQFTKCLFEDKPYKGQSLFGNFLLDCDGTRRIRIDSCRFIVNEKKLTWLNLNNQLPSEEKTSISHSTFIIAGGNYQKNDFVSVMRGVRFKNNRIEFLNKDAKANGQTWPNGCCTEIEDLGGNEVIYHIIQL